MWQKIANFILKHRVLNVCIIVCLMGVMGYYSQFVKMSYEFGRNLPETDSTMIEYNKFLKQFGQDGSSMFFGVQDTQMFELKHFQAWYDLEQKIKKVNNVTNVLSVSSLFDLRKNDSLKRFQVSSVVSSRPTSQAEVDSICERVGNLVLYEGLLWNPKNNVYLMMIDIDKEVVNSKERDVVIDGIEKVVDEFRAETGREVHLTGMPYIRSSMTNTMKEEILLFTVLSIIIAVVLLILFSRAWWTTLCILGIVLISILFVFGTMGLFGFKVTILTGVLPPLLIIICVENSIFLLNKYSREYSLSHDKESSLQLIISRIGGANFLTNATTAASFASFIITRNDLLVEFGILSSVNIFISYFLTMVLLPTFFSLSAPPTEKQMQTTNSRIISWILRCSNNILERYHSRVYWVTIIFSIICIFGASQLKTTGRVVDDISKDSKLYTDMMFFEENVNGVMPYEIIVDTKKPKGLYNLKVIKKIDQLQDTLATYKEFSKPLSIVQVVKFARSAYYNGDRDYFSLPSKDFVFIKRYLGDFGSDSSSMPAVVKSFVDEDFSKTRISVQMANITTPEIDKINKSLREKVDAIFPPEEYEVSLTGNSVVFLEGTNYLIDNLLYSLLLATFVIIILVAFVAKSLRVVIVSMVPNIIPLLCTAALMGFSDISIKTSSIIVFSIALGISVDNTIHFLSRYRQQMKLTQGDIRKSVFEAMKEMAPSMTSSATVLVCGFFIFAFSSFGATQIVGYLVPFTLFVAMITNLLVLPCLTLTINKKKISRYNKL